MDTSRNLRYFMDETSAPYEEGKNPFPMTEEDRAFEEALISKYHLVTKEMERAGKASEIVRDESADECGGPEEESGEDAER